MPADLPEPNYHEVPDYTLPDLLDGADSESWPKRRETLVDLFREHVFGYVPKTPWSLAARRSREAIRDGMRLVEVTLTLSAHGDHEHRQLSASVLVHLPLQADADNSAPAFLGLNFAGNHTISPDPWISLPTTWVPSRSAEGVAGGDASHAGRGCLARRWPVARITHNGYAVATVYSGAFSTDRDNAFADGAHALLDQERDTHSWGTIAAWSWGLSRAREAIQACVPEINAERIAVIGHSRMGKAALWAAAQDEHFAMAVSNDSGCTGAALSRRRIGERLVMLNTRFPHWCCEAYRAYDEREDELPLDQHMLLGAIAPRPLYVASAEGDAWADPDGEFASCLAAAPAYHLHGKSGPDQTRPDLGRTTGIDLAYHRRAGPHDLLELDWYLIMQAADKHFTSS